MINKFSEGNTLETILVLLFLAESAQGIDDSMGVFHRYTHRHKMGGGAAPAGDDNGFPAFDTVEKLGQMRFGFVGTDVLHTEIGNN